MVLSNYNNWTQDKYDRDKVNLARIALYLGPINQHLERIATKNLIRRHLSTRLSQFMLPDFCLKFRPTRPYKDEKNSLIETIPTLERFLDIVNFPMGEENVELTTMMSFINIPVCWMVKWVKFLITLCSSIKTNLPITNQYPNTEMATSSRTGRLLPAGRIRSCL